MAALHGPPEFEVVFARQWAARLRRVAVAVAQFEASRRGLSLADYLAELSKDDAFFSFIESESNEWPSTR